MKWILPALCISLASCSGTHSTIKQGYAYQMTEDQAASLIDSVMRSNIVGDRMLPGGRLVATGYDRGITSTQTYTATAIPITRQHAFGFEVKHEGQLSNGPSKSQQMFGEINQRASLVGKRVNIIP